MGDNSRLDLIADKLELTELVARIARAVDRKDREGILACYAEKSFDDHGRFRGGRDEFAEFIVNNPGFTTASPFLYHLMGQSTFDVEGDEAYGETYFAYWMQTTPDTLYQSIGRYADYFQRIDGRWQLVYRRVVIDWDGTVPATNAVPGGHFRGTRDKSDPTYTRLTWPEHSEHKTSIG
ncbi:nuclear transport factor 2 family protein [Nocardia miyunensis]|uniref:nuclear transport factor 2 family protein n=1 Tax=Nocardia miyunensis TaxID=282684 RepID=UPI00082D286E|nr:nuclear transport factor 2 family protein [Nocardia miyunensis]